MTANLMVGVPIQNNPEVPNQRPGVDAGWRARFAFVRRRPRATQAVRWAAERVWSLQCPIRSLQPTAAGSSVFGSWDERLLGGKDS